MLMVFSPAPVLRSKSAFVHDPDIDWSGWLVVATASTAAFAGASTVLTSRAGIEACVGESPRV
jgi:hypothetical protein